MIFQDLWRESAKMGPAEQQAWLRKQITVTIETMGIAANVPPGPDNPVDSTAERIVIGVAEYSHKELVLLDRVIASLPQAGVMLRVFLMSQCASKQDLDAFVPGVGVVLQSPVVAVYSGNILLEWGSGRVAHDLLGRKFGVTT